VYQPGQYGKLGTDHSKVGVMEYNDLSVGYAFPCKGKLQVGANNVFDRKLRIIYDTNTLYIHGTSAVSSIDPIWHRPLHISPLYPVVLTGPTMHSFAEHRSLPAQ